MTFWDREVTGCSRRAVGPASCVCRAVSTNPFEGKVPRVRGDQGSEMERCPLRPPTTAEGGSPPMKMPDHGAAIVALRDRRPATRRVAYFLRSGTPTG